MKAKSQNGNHSEELLGIYRKMLEIRYFEDRVGALWRKGLLPGVVHLYVGEEAVCEVSVVRAS
jgi:TPP-dependent pyruvate/acetoin dehydrogenase alpha subunit